MYRQDNVSYISTLKCILDLENTKRSVGGLFYIARVSAFKVKMLKIQYFP